MVLLAPVVFAIHVLEESPGFVNWFNSLVARGITQDLFLTVNVTAFVITTLLAALAAATAERALMIATLAWLAFLMFANAVFHIVATVVHQRYCPGVVTATLLYLPYFLWLAALVRKRFAVGLPALVPLVLLAGIPMYAHGYLIVFRGSRLF